MKKNILLLSLLCCSCSNVSINKESNISIDTSSSIVDSMENSSTIIERKNVSSTISFDKSVTLEKINDFTESRLYMLTQNKTHYYILINEKGESIYNRAFDRIEKNFDGGYAIVTLDGNSLLLNSEGNIIKTNYKNILYSYASKRFIAINNDESIDLYNDTFEKIESADKFYYYSRENYVSDLMVDNLLGVKNEKGKIGFIDANANIAIAFEYDDGFIANNDIICVKKGIYYGYIDYKNNILIDFNYTNATPFISNTAYVVDKDEVRSIINRSGNTIYTLNENENETMLIRDVVSTYNNNTQKYKYYFHNKQIVECDSDLSIEYFEDYVTLCDYNSAAFYIVDFNGNIVFDYNKWNDIPNFKTNQNEIKFKTLSKNEIIVLGDLDGENKKAIKITIDNEGKTTSSTLQNCINVLNGVSLLSVKKDDKCALYSLDGSQLTPYEYDSFTTLWNPYLNKYEIYGNDSNALIVLTDSYAKLFTIDSSICKENCSLGFYGYKYLEYYDILFF